MQTTEQNYFYSLQKVLSEFKNSELTGSFDVVDRSLRFIEQQVSFNSQDIIFFELAKFFSNIRDYPLDRITLQTRLKNDLLMSQKDKQFMRVPFNRFIIKQGGKTRVTNNDCEGCKTVTDCVELIKSKLS